MPYVTRARVEYERLRHFSQRDAQERRRQDYLETLARQHAKRTGLSLPVARRMVTIFSIVANKPTPEGRDYAHVEDTLTPSSTPNGVSKFTAEDDAQIRALAGEGLHAGAIARRLRRKGSTVARRARSLGIALARDKRGSLRPK
jgi:hypothetical protein